MEPLLELISVFYVQKTQDVSTLSLLLSLSISFQTFTEGLTNQLLGCYVGSLQEPGCVLVRLYGKMTELYLNRDKEVEMFQLLHAHGCGPQIYCSFQNGICYEFIQGTALDDKIIRQPSIYRYLPTWTVVHAWLLCVFFMESLFAPISLVTIDTQVQTASVFSFFFLVNVHALKSCLL